MPDAPASVVSIGSGTGLLEALILREKPYLSLKAVEVSQSINLYLPSAIVDVVLGTWDISSTVAEAHCWIFVYPRDPRLFKTYVEASVDLYLAMIIWIGPRADAEAYVGLLDGAVWTRKSCDDCGLGSYEVLMSWTRKSIYVEG